MFVKEMFDTAIKELLIREGCAVFSSLNGYDVTFANDITTYMAAIQGYRSRVFNSLVDLIVVSSVFFQRKH
jgi:hypothetical protein